jgi:hypothetical protein
MCHEARSRRHGRARLAGCRSSTTASAVLTATAWPSVHAATPRAASSSSARRRVGRRQGGPTVRRASGPSAVGGARRGRDLRGQPLHHQRGRLYAAPSPPIGQGCRCLPGSTCARHRSPPPSRRRGARFDGRSGRDRGAGVPNDGFPRCDARGGLGTGPADPSPGPRAPSPVGAPDARGGPQACAACCLRAGSLRRSRSGDTQR